MAFALWAAVVAVVEVQLGFASPQIAAVVVAVTVVGRAKAGIVGQSTRPAPKRVIRPHTGWHSVVAFGTSFVEIVGIAAKSR